MVNSQIFLLLQILLQFNSFLRIFDPICYREYAFLGKRDFPKGRITVKWNVNAGMALRYHTAQYYKYFKSLYILCYDAHETDPNLHCSSAELCDASAL